MGLGTDVIDLGKCGGLATLQGAGDLLVDAHQRLLQLVRVDSHDHQVELGQAYLSMQR